MLQAALQALLREPGSCRVQALAQPRDERRFEPQVDLETADGAFTLHPRAAQDLAAQLLDHAKAVAPHGPRSERTNAILALQVALELEWAALECQLKAFRRAAALEGVA